MNRRKQAITDAAIKIFSAEGYKGATMDEIALEAKVAKGTLYYNFNSKEEIFNYIINIGVNHLRELIRDNKDSDLNPILKLKNICKIQLLYFYENKSFVKVILSQLWGTDQRQSNLRDIVKEYINDIKIIIDEAIECNMVKNSDSLVLAHAFFGSFTSIALYNVLNTDKENLNTVIDTTLEFTLRGLGLQIDRNDYSENYV